MQMSYSWPLFWDFKTKRKKIHNWYFSVRNLSKCNCNENYSEVYLIIIIIIFNPCVSTVWLCSQRLLSGALQWKEISSLPVFCCARLAGRNLRVSIHGWISAWRHNCSLLGYYDAHGWERIRWGHQENHWDSPQYQSRVSIMSFII